MSKAAAVTTASFEQEVLNSEVPVLVDFWATWCAPCRAIAPSLDEVAEQFSGTAKVLKVDIDAEGEVASRYGIMSIPTLLFFKEGKIVDSIVGQEKKDVIASKLQKLVG